MAPLGQFIEYQVFVMLYKIAIPILTALGTAGNTISLFVLLKPEQRRSPIARILTALSVTDSFILWGVGLHKWIYAMFDINITESSIFVCKFYSFMTFFLGQLSSFCIAAISLNRFVAIFFPFKAKPIFTLRNTNVLLTCLVIVSVFSNGHVLFGFGFTEQGLCARVEKIYSSPVMKICIYVQLLLFLLSFAFVIVTNICIIRKLVYRRRHFRKQFINAQRSDLNTTSKATWTLVLVNVVYIVCYIPSGAFLIKYRERPLEIRADHETSHEDAVILLFWAVSVIAFFVNSAINFVLYFLSVSKFRKEVKKLLK